MIIELPRLKRLFRLNVEQYNERSIYSDREGGKRRLTMLPFALDTLREREISGKSRKEEKNYNKPRPSYTDFR